MSKFSDALKSLRKGKDYTQKQLADMLGVAESTIGMYERGQREPSFETLEAIADIFNVYMSDLIEEKPADTQADGLNMFMLDDRKKVLMGKVLHLNDENRAKMEGYIDSLLADQQKQ